MTQRGWAAMVATAATLVGCAWTDDARAQDAPRGTVAYFTTTECPGGWSPIEAARGRMVFGASSTQASGSTDGVPLADLEDRQHGHCALDEVTVAAKSISAGGSCCNTTGAQRGEYPVLVTLEAASTGLPFLQLLVCVRS